MKVWKNNNYLLDEEKMAKQEFTNHLIALAPKRKRTGEIPSTQTILGYLYGKRKIKIELIAIPKRFERSSIFCNTFHN